MNHEKTFEWVQFPEGRARFAGMQRGWDERGHKTFALELRGNEYYGEISRLYLDNQNDYNLTIDSFGYGRGEDVGMPAPEAREAFTPDEENAARLLVVQLIDAGLKFEDPPTVLDQTNTSHFMGKIFFNDGWMLVNADRSEETP